MTQTSSQAKILVVDDEEKTQKLIKRFLEAKNFQVVTSGDGKDALVKFDEFQPECVLLDIQMPNLNGVDTLKEIKNRQPEVEVIMLTAATSLTTAGECFNNGAFSVMEKPVNMEYLYSKILEAMKIRRENVWKKFSK